MALDNVEPSSKFLNIFEESLKKNNLEGVDYLEFTKSIASLNGIIKEEDVRFKSAFALLKERGVTQEKLLNTAKHYKKVLSNEEKSFLEALEKNLSNTVIARKKKIESVQKDIAVKEAEIKKLQELIEADKGSLEKLEKDMVTAEAKANETHSTFIASYNHKVSEIDTDIEKIKKYLID